MSQTGFAESIFDGATVVRCPANDGTLTVCAVLQGRNFPMTANVNGELFIPFFRNGQRQVERAPQSVMRNASDLYQKIFQAKKSFSTTDPDAFRNAQHQEIARNVVRAVTGRDPAGDGSLIAFPNNILKDAVVERCSVGGVRTVCARVNNQRFQISSDQLGKISVKVDGTDFPAPKDLVDKTMRLYQGMFDKHFDGRGFDPNSDDSFRDQQHRDFVSRVVAANTGITPARGVKFAPDAQAPVPTPTDGLDLNNNDGGGHDGGGTGETQPIQRPTFEESKTLFEQRKARFKSSESTKKPDIEALKKAIGEPGKGGLTFVSQQCVYAGSNTLYDRSLALGMKPDGTIFAQVLPKAQEGKISLDQLENGGVKLAVTDDPPPALRGKRQSQELGATPVTSISIRSYEDEGKTKYLVRLSQESGPDDENPIVSYCAAKSGSEVKPVTWQDEKKPTTARMANLLSTQCAKCHGPSSSRKVKFNADGTIALQAGQTRAQVNDLIARRVASTVPDVMMPPESSKLSESDRTKLRQLVKLWAETVPRK